MTEKYSVKSYFRVIDIRQPKGRYVYEERIIVVDADSFEHAFEMADAESRRYERNGGSENIKLRYMPNKSDAYLAYDKMDNEMVWEVYSRFRKVSSYNKL